MEFVKAGKGLFDLTEWDLWKSKEALDEMRHSGQTPAGILMFRSAGAEPTLSLFEVHANPGGTVS